MPITTAYIDPIQWTQRTIGDYFEIQAWGLDEKNRQAVWRIKHMPSMVVALPTQATHETTGEIEDIEWTDLRLDRYIATVSKILDRRENHAPVKTIIKPMKQFYSSCEAERMCIEMYFETMDAMRHCANLLTKQMCFQGIIRSGYKFAAEIYH